MVLLLSLGFWCHSTATTVLAQGGKKIKVEVEKGKWEEIDPYTPAPATIKGWTPYADPVKDWTDPAYRHPQYPWVPKEKFPFKPSWPRKNVPYTGEELLWFKEALYWSGEGGITQDYLTQLYSLNRRGLITGRNIYLMRTHYWERFDEVVHYNMGINGIYQKTFTLLDNPPEMQGFAMLVNKYNNAPGKWRDPDRYTWIPAIRRVRRSAGGDRQDDALGFPLTNDDNGERQWWEFTYEIAAEDVLYEVNGAKGYDILGDPKVIADNPAYPGEGVWGDGRNPYRADGGVECWVVKCIPKDPKYYLGYMLIWIAKHTKLEIHNEQYDHEGNLWRYAQIPTWKPYPNAYKGRLAWEKTCMIFGDATRDYWAFQWLGGYKFGVNIPESKYTVTELSKEFFWRPPLGYRPITKAAHFPPYPLLYEEKKHKDRAGVARLEPKIKARFKATQDMWKARGGYDFRGWAEGAKHQNLK